MLALFKFFAFTLLMLTFLVHHGLASLLLRNLTRRHRYFVKSIKRYSLCAHKIFGIRVHQSGSAEDVKGSLIVANHMSYLDVLVLSASYPSLFVTSVEIRETFFLGQISSLAGCFFVERRRSRISPGTKEGELGLMKRKLEEGINVFLFPEGTSSDGSKVLPFKATFFQLAENELPIVPICLKYTGKARSAVPWYGEMTFLDHLFSLCRLETIDAHITQLPMVRGLNKFQLAQQTQSLISGCYE